MAFGWPREPVNQKSVEQKQREMKLELQQPFAERITVEKMVWSFGDACHKMAWGSAVGHSLFHITEIFPSYRKRHQLIGKASTCAHVCKKNRTGLACGTDLAQLLTQLNLWITPLVHTYVCYTLPISSWFPGLHITILIFKNICINTYQITAQS